MLPGQPRDCSARYRRFRRWQQLQNQRPIAARVIGVENRMARPLHLGVACPQSWYLGEFRLITTPMPTCIVRAYTPDGFVIASDGLNAATDATAERKIFTFPQSGDLAFSFAGSIGWPRFNLIDAFRFTIAALSPAHGGDVRAWLQQVAEVVNQAIMDARDDGRIRLTQTMPEREPDGFFTIAKVLVDGYFDGVPIRFDILFSHRRQEQRGRVWPVQLTNQPDICGSHLIADIYSTDPVFAKYRPEGPPLHASTLLDAEIIRARWAIAAQGSEEAKAMDNFCGSVGGRTAIATITRDEGFAWISPEFEPA
jgi:hypothetical protein